jgi:exopolysaccharide biosynthesis polyprenyl glycosylphosphotransferase
MDRIDIASPQALTKLNGTDSTMDGEDLLTPTQSSRVRAVRGVSGRVLGPLVAAGLVALFADDPVQGAVLGFLAFGVAFFVGPQRGTWASMLPLMRSPLHATRPLLGLAALAVVQLVTGDPGLNPLQMVAVAAGATLPSMLSSLVVPQAWAPDRAIRIALIGSSRTATELARELRLEEVPEYLVAGRIEVEPNGGDRSLEMPTLGHLAELAEIVEQNGVKLLIFSSEVPRFALFKQVADTCLDLPVRMWELSSFYEDVFGHVPVAEINPSWFQYIMHPKYRAVAPRSKRALDILVALPIGLLSLPILAVVALIIRRDGGPVFFKQRRIGEGGRPITLIKLRTMKVDNGEEAQWASADDPRVTPIGRFLRRTHLDEFPQIINVLRGDMSLVGPRPEQPEFVERLEELIPFYARRHLIKPGITGWAQVRCGYAGSDTGSAWKLSHDLYYLKHRSMAFDLAILGETVRTLFADRQHKVAPMNLSFVQSDTLAVESSQALNS